MMHILAESNGLLHSIMADGGFFWAVAGIVAIVAIVFTMTAKMVQTRAREQTKREIAAYVAEGSIDPDKAVDILRAGRTFEEALSDTLDRKKGSQS